MIVRNVRALKRCIEADVTLWSAPPGGATSQVILHVEVAHGADAAVDAALMALRLALHTRAQQALQVFAGAQVPTP